MKGKIFLYKWTKDTLAVMKFHLKAINYYTILYYIHREKLLQV